MIDKMRVLGSLAACASGKCSQCGYNDDADRDCTDRLSEDAIELISDLEAQLLKAYEDNGKLLRRIAELTGESGESVCEN